MLISFLLLQSLELWVLPVRYSIYFPYQFYLPAPQCPEFNNTLLLFLLRPLIKMSSNMGLNNRNFTNNLPLSQQFNTTLCSLPISSVLIFFIFLYKLSTSPSVNSLNVWHWLPLCRLFHHLSKDQHSQNNFYALLPVVVNEARTSCVPFLILHYSL